MKKILYILIAVSLFSSCEYEPSGNNFIELTPPDDFIAVNISLNDVDPADTIYVFQDTRISIRINSEKTLKQAVALLNGKEYYLSNSSDFIIRRNELNEGVYKLTVNAVFSSGTGSLAEMMGMEGYIGEMSWNIRIMPDPASCFTVDYRLNDDGFLELYWENIIPEDAIKEYVVRPPYYTQENIHIIDNPMQKSFIDYGYVCGYISYEVMTNLKSGYSYSQIISLDKPIPNIYFEDLGLNELRVYWDKPFANGRFSLTEGDSTIVSIKNDTTITISQLFGPNRHFGLEIRPLKPEYDSSRNQFYVWNWFSQGSSLNLPNWPLYAYNATENLIYSTRYNQLVAFDANTLEEMNHVTIQGNPWGLSYGGRLACAPHNSTVAAMTGEETWIFTDKRFVDPVIIQGLRDDRNIRLCALTSDDRFFVVSRNSNDCQVFNAKTGEKIFTFQFKYSTIYDIPDFVTVSDDGRYFCASSENGMEIFEIEDTTTHLLYTDTRCYKGAMFLPSQPDKILFRVDADFEIRQIPDFSLTQKFDVSQTVALFCSIDPVTQNLLYYQDDFLKVAPVNNMSNLIFKIKSSLTFPGRTKLLNNKILINGHGGAVFDISPDINK